ncbi:transcription factor RFX4 isoform X2 [Nematostella vectensis]|uniref:transcription factor RFX4 isoform X2 n=1 Tax=Nematostella vectensis TaxID=45351 RepID=UPI00138FC205|nr:transcription factor RFX4 isoform X2 [Nematostella vectensis]
MGPRAEDAHFPATTSMPRSNGQQMYPGNSYMSHSKLQSPLTIQWLNENYEVADGVSLPRSALYSHYLDFCEKNSLSPVNAASFGKIIRHTFPNLKTRRLGTRGQSKYHYYGITIKTTSPYHDTVCNAARQSSSGFSQTYSKVEVDDRTTSHSVTKSAQGSSSSLIVAPGGTLLPSFPSVNHLNLPAEVSRDKVKTFLIMYRAHCQRILDTILRANFGEVQNFLVHFWQGMPSHMLEVLGCSDVVDLIGVCDGILYKAISGVLIPGTLQPLPASLTQAIRHFAKQLGRWLEESLAHLPAPLQQRKLSVAKSFAHSLRRQTSLTHLAQAARTVLHSAEPVTQMLQDWKQIDFEGIARQAMWTFSQNVEKDYAKIKEIHTEFTQLLDQQATIDQYAEWASSLVDRCVTKRVEKEGSSYQKCAQDFLLKWSFFSIRIVRELTLHSAHSFGSFHLLHMLLEDYILFIVENQSSQDDVADVPFKSSLPDVPLFDADEPMEIERSRDHTRSKPRRNSSSSSSGVLLSPRDVIQRSSVHVPPLRSPYREVSPHSLTSPTNSANKMTPSEQSHFIYPPTPPEVSPRYPYASAQPAINQTPNSYPTHHSTTESTVIQSSYDIPRGYSGIDRFPTPETSTFLPPRSKSTMGTGYTNASSGLPYDYRSFSPMVVDHMKHYSQYALPERNYPSSYMFGPSVVTTPNNMYPLQSVSGNNNERYYPDVLEEFVDMQAAMHHGLPSRSCHKGTRTVLSSEERREGRF